MVRALTVVFLIVSQAPIVVAASGCSGADLAMTSVTVQNVTKTQYLNNYRLVGTVTNIGGATQPSNVLQFVDISQYGDRLDDRGVPPLAPGQSYTVAYVWKRSVDAGNLTTPLSFHLRGVPVSPSADDCNPANDSHAIQF
jgi:hypothetical protein